MKDRKILQTLLAPNVEAMGYELWGCVLIPQGRSTLLRVYIDSPQGIKLVDCERVSRQISAVLDVEDPIRGSYSLEVSSPGLDRPLFSRDQFERYVGAGVDIHLQTPSNGRRHMKGTLLKVKNDDIVMSIEGQEFVVALNNIARARLISGEGSS